MGDRIFMSVPDGPYWKAKEAKERARARTQRGVVETVRSPAPGRTQQGVRREDNER